MFIWFVFLFYLSFTVFAYLSLFYVCSASSQCEALIITCLAILSTHHATLCSIASYSASANAFNYLSIYDVIKVILKCDFEWKHFPTHYWRSIHDGELLSEIFMSVITMFIGWSKRTIKKSTNLLLFIISRSMYYAKSWEWSC